MCALSDYKTLFVTTFLPRHGLLESLPSLLSGIKIVAALDAMLGHSISLPRSHTKISFFQSSVRKLANVADVMLLGCAKPTVRHVQLPNIYVLDDHNNISQAKSHVQKISCSHFLMSLAHENMFFHYIENLFLRRASWNVPLQE